MTSTTTSQSPSRATTLGIGLVGAGGIAGAHVAGIRRHPDLVRLAAVADPVTANAERRRGDDDAAVYADYADLLADPAVDAVDICLPHHLHKDAIVAAADAGKHVLCEKPLCLTLDEAAEIDAAVRRNGVTVMCAHNQLFVPGVRRARELLDEGVLGDVYAVRITEAFRNEFTPESMGWRAVAATAGGGELIDTGYHPTYLMLHLAGSEPSEVTAMLSRHRLDFMDGEDSADLLVRFADGTAASIETSWAYAGVNPGEKAVVVGERGALRVRENSVTLLLRDAEPVEEVFEPVHDFAAEIEHFARSLREGERPVHTHVDGTRVLAVILAAYESERTGARVAVPPVAERAPR